MKQIQSEFRKLKSELSGIAIGSDVWYKKMAETQKVENVLHHLIINIKEKLK